MCGILAIILGPTTPSLQKLSKRGPDEQGSYSDKDIYLGHTRLSIVHPEAGAQPIIYKNWIVTMNGEIYNANPPVNETDCFLVPYLLDKHGIDCVQQLDGIFSFVAYNKITKQVVVARDAIGVTPLYWSQSPTRPSQITVASLLAALPLGETASIVPPGTTASFIVGGQPHFIKWSPPYNNWTVAVPPVPPVDILNVMQRAVAKRMGGDVPWGVLLSGGLDSTIVATLAVKMAKQIRPDYPVVHSFCIGLKDSPDVIVAKQVAAEIGTYHTTIEYTIEQGIEHLNSVIQAIETYDLTTVRASTPMWILGKSLKARGIKMVLSGEGADELFAGYLYNLYCPSEADMVVECQKKMSQLHAYDCQRANKTLGDWGVETRVPFLDTHVVDLAMNRLPPVFKMSGTHPSGPKPEKWWLREAFRGIIPDCVVDRTKAQFSDAVGSSWINSLIQVAELKIADGDFANAAQTFPYNTPTTKEAYLYRTMFEQYFHQLDAEKTVLYTGNSIACSTGDVMNWHPEFKTQMDPSGESILRIH